VPDEMRCINDYSRMLVPIIPKIFFMTGRIMTCGCRNSDILRLLNRIFKYFIFNIKVCRRSAEPKSFMERGI